MIVAIWIIAICEIVRALQNGLQLYMVHRDTGARDDAYKAFVYSLNDSDEEMVRKLLEEFERKDGDDRK